MLAPAQDPPSTLSSYNQKVPAAVVVSPILVVVVSVALHQVAAEEEHVSWRRGLAIRFAGSRLASHTGADRGSKSR